MSVGSQYGTYPAVKVPAHCHFLRSHFCVHIHYYDRSLFPHIFQYPVDSPEWAIQVLHKYPAAEIYYSHLKTSQPLKLIYIISPARRVGRIIGRFEQPVFPVQKVIYLPFLKYMVSGRYHVNTHTQQAVACLN